MWQRRRPWQAESYWALDLETSGLDARRDAILSVGMVPIRDGLIRYGERWYSLVRPPASESLSQEGLGAHHILPSELASAPLEADVLAEIDRRLTGTVLIVHFGRIDLGFLEAAYRRCGLTWPKPPTVDTVDLLYRLARERQRFHPHPQAPRTGLSEARTELGLPQYTNHHALWDALATAELFLALRARLGAKTLRGLR